MGDAGPPRALLEGRPGIGKTMVVRRLTTLLRDAGLGMMELASAPFRDAVSVS